MQINLTNMINKLSDNRSPRSSQRKGSVNRFYELGHSDRIKDLPSSVDEKFIEIYKENLDQFLIPYINSGEMSVRRAHKFIEDLVTQIFGNYDHYGLFSYLRERNYENDPENKLVITCEKLISLGWRIRKDSNTGRYKLYNSEGNLVIDVTGKSDFYDEVQAAIIDEGSAHLFIKGEDASKIELIARRSGFTADQLNELNSLESLIPYSNDKSITGVLSNYKKLKSILQRKSSYKKLSKSFTTNDLYSQGFEISDSMIFSEDKLVLDKGNESYIVYPVSPEMNTEYVVRKDLLSVISSNLKHDLFKNFSGVVSQELIEIKEIDRVFAIMVEKLNNDFVFMSYSDTVDAFRRMDSYVESGEITKNFYNLILQRVSQVLVTESILLGNNWFSVSGISIDSISGKVYSYPNRDAFSTGVDSLKAFVNAYKPKTASSKNVLSKLTDQVFPARLTDGTFRENCYLFIENLPPSYFKYLNNLEVNFEGYGLSFDKVIDYVNEARDFLLSRAD